MDSEENIHVDIGAERVSLCIFVFPVLSKSPSVDIQNNSKKILQPAGNGLIRKLPLILNMLYAPWPRNEYCTIFRKLLLHPNQWIAIFLCTLIGYSNYRKYFLYTSDFLRPIYPLFVWLFYYSAIVF